MSRYRVAPEARADLDEVYDYVAKESLSAADELIETFQERFRLLATQPLMGQARPELGRSLHSFTVGNYVIFYRPAEGGIEVAKIIHSARDIEALF